MRSSIFSLVVLIALAGPVFAEQATEGKISKKLQGSWIVDSEASAKNMKSSPKFKSEDEKMLPMMASMLSKMCVKFTEDEMIISMGSREQKAEATLVSEKGGEYQIKMQAGEGRTTELKATLTKGKLNLSDGKGDMMNYVVWKKGTLSDSAKNADVMAEVLKQAMKEALKQGLSSGADKPNVNKDTNNPAAQTNTDYKLKFNRVEISRLSDKTIAEINAIEKKPSRIQIQKECSQEDFNKISAFPWAKEVFVSGSTKNINSIEVLAKMPDLEMISLLILETSKENPVDLTPLSGLSKLEWLSCMGTRVKSTVPLSKLTRLKRAEFHTSAVDSIDFVKNNPDLEHLGLYGNKHTFKDYQPVAGLKKLKSIDIYMNIQVADESLAPLANITTLERIHMSHSKEVTTLDFLKNCQNMKYIDANWCDKLSDISCIAGMSKLEELKIDDIIAKDFSVLKGKPNLKVLNVEDTSFSDLSLLKESTKLMSLNIKGTQVKDISILKDFKKLKYLTVSKNFSAEQIDMLKKEYPKLKVWAR